MKYDKNKMIQLQSQGETYDSIAKKLGCSKWTVDYNLNPKRKKSQTKYDKEKKQKDALYFKRKRFLSVGNKVPFTLTELKNKIGADPKCYITGEPIDLSNPNDYSLDHIVPVSKGGESSLSNLGLVKSDINQAKYNFTPEEFLLICKRVLLNN
jgi:CRISPR/Cas system Type II protein with McrA/HNH and RuvC-like nuclease domain